jgi:hypothetical protein
MSETPRTRVTILTSSYRVKGAIELLPGARVTDFMNEAKGFIAVTDAEVWESNERRVLTTPFLNVSKEHVVIVTPD